VTLLEHALSLVKSLAVPVCIVGDKAKFSELGDVVEDVYKGCGPLGGIHAALAQTTAEFNLMLGVDLPFVEKEFMEHLVSRAQKADAVVTVARTGSGFQPLCAVYRKEFAGVAENSLRAGRNKIDSLFAEVSTEVISEQEWVKAGFSVEMFRNLNTPADWEQARITLK
jgi:molybdopterin-guanine dinucleotide biosynthesis protein A